MAGKRMTKAQKKANAALKREWKEKGILPPDKPRLNRKKYIEEAREEWNRKGNQSPSSHLYLIKAISVMLGHTERGLTTRASPEAVGVAKCLKLALRLEEFDKEVAARGETSYKVSEQYEYIRDILDA